MVRSFYTVVHLCLKLHMDVDYPVLTPFPDHGGVIPRLSDPDFVSQALENNQSCETKSGTGSLGSRLSVNYVRAYVIYCA